MLAGLTAPVLVHAPLLLAATTPAKKGSPVPTLILLGVVILAGVLFFRNNRRRVTAQQQAQEEIVPGSRIVTRSGLIATLVERTDDEVVLEIAPGVRATFVPQAIGRVLPTDDPETPTAPPDPDGPDAPEEK